MRKFPRKLSKTVKQQIIEKFIKLEVQPRRYNNQVIAFTDREIKGKGEKKISNKTLEEHFWDIRDIGFTIESIQHNGKKKTQTESYYYNVSGTRDNVPKNLDSEHYGLENSSPRSCMKME